MKDLCLFSCLLLLSTQAFAATELQCKVNESMNPPYQVRSREFTVTAPLTDASLFARIDLDSTNFNLHYGFETFLSQISSPGQQVILIGLTARSPKFSLTTDGHGTASTFYDTEEGTLFIQCSTK